MPDTDTLEARKGMASKWAAKYGLDLAIVCAVIEQESGWYTYAVRFEPAFLARYIHPANSEKPTTRELCLAMSFGLMQVMGEVAKEMGFTRQSYLELCDPDVGIDFGCRKLQKCFNLHGTGELGLLAYNGGSNALYASQVLARVATYQ